MDKYVLTIEQLEQLAEDACWSMQEQSTNSFVREFLKEEEIPTESSNISLAWLEGFNKAKSIALEALNNA